MHEMSYVVRFVNLALEKARENGACGVKSLTVSVGEMTDIVPEYLYKYYPEVVKGTIMEEAVLKVEMVPVKIRCAGCGEIYHPQRSNSYACPLCGKTEGKICQGRGMEVRELEIVTPDPQ